MLILCTTALMLGFDIISRLDGNPGTVYSFLNEVGNFMVFSLSLVIPSLSLVYVYNKVYEDDRKTRRLFVPLSTIIVLNFVVSILSTKTGWYYSIDSMNIYHRGPLYFLPILITCILMFLTAVLVIKNRKELEKRAFFSLTFFVLTPIFCIFLQIVFYGFSLILNGVVLSLLVEFLNVNKQSLNTDYLTGVSNRKKLDEYLNKKIRKSNINKSFSGIILDLKGFKSINDSFGHDMGDKALQSVSKLLKSNLKSSDLIARYGGDEFYLVLDISNKDELEEKVGRIKQSIKKYNATSSYPFQLDFNMGYLVYDYQSSMKADDFIRQVDRLMYENRAKQEEIRRTS